MLYEVITDAYPDTIFSALVTDLGVIADPYTGTYEAEILLEGTIPGFRSGLIASVITSYSIHYTKLYEGEITNFRLDIKDNRY